MENGRRSDFHSATKVELNVASQDPSAQEIIAAFSDGAVKLMMDTIPIRYGPRFSRLFAEHIRSLEARHAAAIAPGTNNWADAIYALHLRAGSLGPKKAAVMLGKASDFLQTRPQAERAAFVLSKEVRGSRRTSLIIASIGFGPHPDPLTREEGIALSMHLIESARAGTQVLAGIPIAFVSNHAVGRMFERGLDDLTEYSHVVVALGAVAILASLLSYAPQHRDGGIHLALDNLLLTGAMLTKPGSSYALLDIRTALPIDELSLQRRPCLEQGCAASEVVMTWLAGGDDCPDNETLVARIPALPRRADNYLAVLNREERPL